MIHLIKVIYNITFFVICMMIKLKKNKLNKIASKIAFELPVQAPYVKTFLVTQSFLMVRAKPK